MTSADVVALGLSPLARGNLNGKNQAFLRRGPIPARAGEPPYVGLTYPSGRAYPRSRGGTIGHAGNPTYGTGLSPLARGNLTQRVAIKAHLGPIPARAGEPA